MDIKKLLAKQAGIRLDIGCGDNKQTGFVGMDIRDLPGVDIVHDWNVFPWPLPDECVVTAMAAHVIEHVPPWDFGFIKFMDEVWRILKPEGQFAIVCPHGLSQGYLQDPTHCNPVNENTFFYFTPGHPLYNIYRPKPWQCTFREWSPNANIEVILVKILAQEEAEDEQATAVD